MADHDKKVVREKRLRQEKIKEALAKKPSTPFMNSHGMSPAQIHQQLHQQRLHGASKNTLRTTLKRETLSLHNQSKRKRPSKAERSKAKNLHPHLLLGTPNVTTGLSVEYPTPNWFRKSETEKVDVSVIVPLFKSKDVVKGLIRSWDIQNSGLNVEMIFVDDDCPHDSKNMAITIWGLRRIELEGKTVGNIYYNPSNLGFGMTCNVGAYYAKGEYLIFLNADTLVTKNWIKPVVELLEDPEVGIVGNLQLKKGGPWDGTIDSAGSEWSWSAKSFLHIGRHTFNHKGLSKPFYPNNAPASIMRVGEREMVTGCCFGIRNELFKEIGGFNPNYRIGYWEDSELCMMVREKGYKIMFQPHSKIFHLLGHTGSGPHRFQEHNRTYFMNKWINSGRLDNLVTSQRKHVPKLGTILLRRREAHGDVLLAAAVAPALKKKHPDCRILFNTKCPEILAGNPFIDKIVEDSEISERSFQVYYNLDMVYEQRPHTHILDSYADAVGVKREDCRLFLETKNVKLPSDYVVIHPGRTSWVGRDWKRENFVAIARRLRAEGHHVVCVGKKGDHEIPCDADFRSKTTIAELASIIQGANLFIGIDSFPMHVAQTFNVPGVAFFGSIDPKLRIVSDNLTAVTAENLGCLGCHHRKPAPSVVTNTCETVTLDCVDLVSVETMWKAIKEKLYANPVHDMSPV